MLLMLALAAAPIACPIERAHYALRHHPNLTARFRRVDSGPDWPSGLALAVQDRKSARTWWWLPWNGGTDGLQHVASTTDVTARDWRPPDPDGGPRPLGDRQYIGTDASYDVIGHVPRRGEAAPAHMLLPDSAGSRDTAFPIKQFFDLVRCSPKGN